MKQLLLICILLSSFTLAAQTPEQQPVIADTFPLKFDYNRDFRRIKAMAEEKDGPYSFQKLIQRFLQNDVSLTRPEVLALMIGFTDNNNFQPLENIEIEKEIIALNDEGFFEDAIEESKKYLRKNPLSLSTNKEISYAYHSLGKKDSAKFFMFRNDLIMEAMIFSGGAKGRTPETAFFSLGLNDGDYFIPNVGFSATHKSLTKDKNRYTIYQVVAMNIESAKTNYYFNIHHAKMKADADGVASKRSSKVDKARKKQAASRKWKKGKNAKGENAEEGAEATEQEETFFENPIPETQVPEVEPGSENPVTDSTSVNSEIPPATEDTPTEPEAPQNANGPSAILNYRNE